MLLKDFIRDSVNALSALYDADEARSMVMYYCAEAFGFPSYQHITEPSTEVPPELLDEALADMRRLADSEPLQYVLGYTEFCGRNFRVDARALIPRAETEVLCMKAEELLPPLPCRGWHAPQGEEPPADPVRSFAAADGNTPPGGSSFPAPYAPLRVLDLCTGSGCIAWTLALDLPGAEVTATDLSADALALAGSQFRGRDAVPGWTGRLPKRVVRPRFVEADVLDVAATLRAVLPGPSRSVIADSDRQSPAVEAPASDPVRGSAAADGNTPPGGVSLSRSSVPDPTGHPSAGFHLLTANPPYVMSSEKAEMRPNVLGWEPHMAIFAPDRDPLAFHRAIARIALGALVPGGRGIVEINSELPEETAEVFSSAGLSSVQIIPDYFSRPRFVSFLRP